MKKGIKFVFAVLVVFLCGAAVSTVSAATYYVATTGNDTTGNGSFSLPWKTIGKAASVMVAGDTTYIRGGTYNITGSITPANSGSAGNYITFSAYQNEVPIINGQGGNFRGISLTSGHSYFRFVGLTLQNFGSSSGGGILLTLSHHIEILNCNISGCGVSSIKLSSTHDVILAGMDVQTSKYGFEVTPAGGTDIYNIQLIDCVGHSMNPSGLADGFVIKQFVPYVSRDIYIAGCKAYDLWDDGFDIFAGKNILVEHCIAYDVDASQQVPASPTEQYDEDGHGFKVYALDTPTDPGGYHCQFIRCLAYDDNREGFKLSSLPKDSSTYNGKIRMVNCTSADTDYGILIVTQAANPMEVEIKNCLASTINRDPLDPYYGDDLSRALHVENEGFIIWSIEPLVSYFIPDMDYNLWYTRDWDDTVIEPIDFLGTLYTGGDVNDGTFFTETTCGEHSMSYDPLFTDADSNDFTLSATSPCIDAGTDVGLPYEGSAPDMGFFESGTVEVNCPATYLTTGENWISIPVAAINDGPYSVFKDLGTWPNCVYLNLYRYDSPTASFAQYPTYQSDTLQFGKITPGGAYKLMLGGNQTSLKVSGIELSGTQTLTIGGSGTRYFYFGDPFNKPLYRSNCRIKNGGNEVSLNQAVSNGWVSNPEHFNPSSKSWETAGNILPPWHAYRLQALTAGELQLVIYYPLTGNIDNDSNVDFDDLGIMGNNWLDSNCSSIPEGNLDSDCDVDFKDYAILAGNWLAET